MRITSRFNIIVLTLLLFMLPSTAFAATAPPETGAFLNQFSWIEIVNPLFILVLAAIFAVYLWVMHLVSKKHDVEHRGWKAFAFLAGLLIVYISLSGPIGIYADNLTFSAHMVQQSLMYIGMPLVILLGVPRVFYVYLDEHVFKHTIMRLFKSPIISILLFNLLLSFSYIPFIYEFLAQQTALQVLVKVVINAAAFLMWIHVLAPVGLINKMSNVLKIGYVFLNGLLLMPLCALIIFANDIIYQSIYDAPLPFSYSTPLDDQKLGGLILQSVQQLFFVVTITFTFFRWAREEKIQEVDELPENHY